MNIENMFNEKYFVAADNDNNIGPGAPITVRATPLDLDPAQAPP